MKKNVEWIISNMQGLIGTCLLVVILLIAGIVKFKNSKEIDQPPRILKVNTNKSHEHLAKSAGRWFARIKGEWKKGWLEGVHAGEVVSNVVENIEHEVISNDVANSESF